MNPPARIDAVIGLRREEVGDRVVGHIPNAPHLRSDRGVRSGVVLGAMDATAGLACGLASLPAWTVTTSLMAVVSRHDHSGPLRLDARVLRASRARVVASVDVRDEGNHDVTVAHGVLTTTVLDPAAGPPAFARPVVAQPPVVEVASLEVAMGIEPARGPTTTLHLHEGTRNRWGILHGGAMALLVDVAAERAAGTGAVSSVVLHFLAPARHGPMEARCDVRDGLVVVSVHDTGQDDRQVALAAARVGS